MRVIKLLLLFSSLFIVGCNDNKPPACDSQEVSSNLAKVIGEEFESKRTKDYLTLSVMLDPDATGGRLNSDLTKKVVDKMSQFAKDNSEFIFTNVRTFTSSAKVNQCLADVTVISKFTGEVIKVEEDVYFVTRLLASGTEVLLNDQIAFDTRWVFKVLADVTSNLELDFVASRVHKQKLKLVCLSDVKGILQKRYTEDLIAEFNPKLKSITFNRLSAATDTEEWSHYVLKNWRIAANENVIAWFDTAQIVNALTSQSLILDSVQIDDIPAGISDRNGNFLKLADCTVIVVYSR